jgi:hypothetical protein
MIQWRKSSHSQGGQGECVELGIDRRKSSRSQPSGGECVEVGINAIGAVRDSKHPDAPYLSFSPHAFAAFLSDVKQGKHDL